MVKALDHLEWEGPTWHLSSGSSRHAPRGHTQVMDLEVLSLWMLTLLQTPPRSFSGQPSLAL